MPQPQDEIEAQWLRYYETLDHVMKTIDDCWAKCNGTTEVKEVIAPSPEDELPEE